MEEYDSKSPPNGEGYVIAVAMRKNTDGVYNGGYHLFRLSGDQQWESKDGATEAKIVGTNNDDLGIIASKMDYPDGIRYYYILRINRKVILW